MNRNVWKRVALLVAVLALLILVAQVVVAQDIIEAVAVSTTTSGTTDDGVDYDPNDILVRITEDMTNTVNATDTYWWKLFDGDDYGLDSRHVINALDVIEDGDCGLECAIGALMSFKAQSVKVPGLTPKVEGQDLVFTEFYDPPAPPNPFELIFDGSDVGLTTVEEKIDGVDYWYPELVSANDVELPFDCTEGVLFVSTQGAYRVPAANGGSLVGDGSDILLFCATNFGPNTTGFWFRGHDESDHDLSPSNVMSDIDVHEALLVDPAAVEDEEVILFFSFIAHQTFTGEGGVAGGPSEVFYFPAECDYSGYGGPVIDLNQDWPALNGKATGYDFLGYFNPLPNADC